LVTSGLGAAAAKRLWIAASVVGRSPSAWPQVAQNRASAATAASQRGQFWGVDSTLIGLIVAQGAHGAGAAIADAAPFAGGCLAVVPPRLRLGKVRQARAPDWHSRHSASMGAFLDCEAGAEPANCRSVSAGGADYTR
jgi:hypothetical protein